MRMSSGLRIRAPQDPDYDFAGPYPDHLYLYTGGVNSFHYAATRPSAVAAEHDRPLPQHRSGPDQLSDQAGGRKTWGRVSVVSATRAVRQDRHSHHGDRDRPIREFSRTGI